MIVLFNTAYRPGYLQNVLRTMFLPAGSTNQYRYSIGENLQITKEIASSLQAFGEERVLICFGDRFSEGGYTFHPIRLGTLEKIDLAGSRAYFSVRLGEHVSCASPSEFTVALYALTPDVGQTIPRLTNNDPLNTGDGRYAAHFGDDAVLPLLEINEFSWSVAAGGLAKAKAFLSTVDKKFIFAKCQLLINGLPKDYVRKKGSSRYEMERDDDARLSISYFFPGQLTDRTTIAKLSVSTPPGMQLLGVTEHSLEMAEDRIDFPLVIEPSSDKRFFTVDAKFFSGSSDVEVVGPHEALAVKVSETGWRQLLAVVFALTYVWGAIFAVSNQAAWGEALKGIGLVGIFFTLGGKKIV